MPVLPNERHERFAQELAKGKPATEAYEKAGYKHNRHNAASMRQKKHILERVAELQTRSAQKAEVTIESLIAEVEEARVRAMELGQISAAVAASREKGILSGKRVEKRETGGPGDFDRMSDDELVRFIADREDRTRPSARRVGYSS